MIDDVLMDAIHDIQEYQRDWPNHYAGFAGHIEHVKETMARFVFRMFMPPGTTPANWVEVMIERFTDPEFSDWGEPHYYRAIKADAARILGASHPLLLRLNEVEPACLKGDCSPSIPGHGVFDCCGLSDCKCA